MANYRFLIDSNTFWMDLGTSKISRFVGPVVDPWTPYSSWIYFKKYKKNVEIALKNINFSYLRIWKFENFRNPGNLSCPVFEFLKLRIPEFEFLKFRIPEFLIIRNDDKSVPTSIFVYFLGYQELQQMSVIFLSSPKLLIAKHCVGTESKS